MYHQLQYNTLMYYYMLVLKLEAWKSLQACVSSLKHASLN